jgi:hypothetical protein
MRLAFQKALYAASLAAPHRHASERMPSMLSLWLSMWREAQVLVGDGGLVVDVADPLEVIEQVMKYFYGLGVHGAKNKAPVDEVQKCCQSRRTARRDRAT